MPSSLPNFDHIADATKMVQPAPVPLPESVESALGVVALSDYPSVEPVLRFHISDLARRLAEAEVERDALRERCGKLEWLVEVQEFYMYRLRNPGGWSTPGMEREKIGVAWQRRSAANDELRAMYLAATEAK